MFAVRSIFNTFNCSRTIGRHFVRCSQPLFNQAEPLTIPEPIAEKSYPPKIQNLVNDISQLTLVEVSELSELLKKSLNLPDAPVMPMGGFIQSKNAQDEDEVEQKQVQTAFTVILKSFTEDKKIGMIKEIKNLIEGFNLVQAKKFVEALPAVIKANISKDEADKIKESLTSVGGEVIIE